MASNLFSTSLGWLRVVGVLEGISYLMLFGISMPLKYMMDMPEPNKVIGMAHGVLFVAYVGLVFYVRSEYGWKMKRTFLALLASIVPFGTFWADKKLFREEQQAQ